MKTKRKSLHATETGQVPQSMLWSRQIPSETWPLYRAVIREAQARDIPFALGGGLALAAYTGHLRSTKDVDFFLQPQHREPMIRVLSECGMEDLHDRAGYDRSWIYRAYHGDTILDIMWAMPNQRAQVDSHWMFGGPEIWLRDVQVRVIPPEELLWAKLYVMQRDRCDWPDVLNLLESSGKDLDWHHLMNRLGDDAPLLRGLLAIFGWLRPGQLGDFPEWIWRRLLLPQPGERDAAPGSRPREELLDQRDWFVPGFRERMVEVA